MREAGEMGEIQDWLAAEREYMAQRLLDGDIPHQFRRPENTIERRAYAKYEARTLRLAPARAERA